MGCACGKKKESKSEIYVNLKEGIMVSDDRFQVNLKETIIDLRKKIFKQTGQSTFNKKLLLGGMSIDENKQIGPTATSFRNGSTITLVNREIKYGEKFLQDKGIYSFTYMFHDKMGFAKLKLFFEENELDDLTTPENVQIKENDIIEVKSF